MSYLDCPVGCGRQRQPRHLMCTPCWRRVPHFLKREVHRTWKEVERTSEQDAYDEYDRIRNEAIASVA